MFNREPLWWRVRTAIAGAMGWTDPAAQMNAALAQHPEKIRAIRMTVRNGSRLAMGLQPTMVFNPGWYWGPQRGAALLEVVRVEGSRLFVRDASPGAATPMCCTTCWLAATWPWLPLPALPPGVVIDIRTLRLEGWVRGWAGGGGGGTGSEGRGGLVALSLVPKTSAPWQNRVLSLPTDALSVLKVRYDWVRMEFLP
ncbi:hypothetical protein TSOC_002055 [Tetrabaena socialis]|uniref:Uncharacterized protein n=1 Tax=Tetrabaena socialis TaxID=47790 RepID=A0A2J8AF39_9CHLO|nr:hypothetical protein TSOC_002055 [Tetrabaena socialis]|eukprot:PNH11134.1 hypothetical protein TSOC_002055 [Tetrabaena socialis]